MASNADSVSDHSLSLSGKAIGAFIKEPVCAIHAVKTKTYVKCAHWTWNSDFRCRLGTSDVE